MCKSASAMRRSAMQRNAPQVTPNAFSMLTRLLLSRGTSYTPGTRGVTAVVLVWDRDLNQSPRKRDARCWNRRETSFRRLSFFIRGKVESGYEDLSRRKAQLWLRDTLYRYGERQAGIYRSRLSRLRRLQLEDPWIYFRASGSFALVRKNSASLRTRTRRNVRAALTATGVRRAVTEMGTYSRRECSRVP